MKIFSFYLLLATALVCSALDLPPPAVNTVAFNSTVAVWSGHTTVRERVDAGVNERIELWNRTWTVSPSGQTYSNTDHWGFNAPDGYAFTTITLNETGRWFYWASDGGSIDNFVYGDGPYDWYIGPHNPPNGAGYGGWGRRVTAYLDVQPLTANYSLTTSVSGSGSVSGGGSYSSGATATVTATPGSGFTFSGWQGALSGTANPASLTMDGDKSITAVFTAVNAAPTIAWNLSPASAASGQSYTVRAHGHDADGNLTQVNVWKDGAAFAFAGGGNGFDNDAGNPTSDTGPATITFTANAVDASGATSGTISHTVTIAAANRAPTIAWNTTPGTVASTQSFTVSAHGNDADGNLTQVNVWKNGVGFAFAGGGNGTDNDSGNTTSATGPTTITFSANAVDSNGATSATITQTVTVSAANAAPTVAWNTTPGTVASGQSYTVSAHGHDADGNLTQVNVWKAGAGFAFTGGGNGTDNDSGNTTADTGPTTITFSANAVDSNGATSATITQTVTVSAANAAPTIAWNTTPGTVASGQNYTVSAHGHDADGNLTQVNVWKSGVGFAFSGGGNGTDNDSGNTTSDTGPATITFSANAVDSSGTTSATITQTVTVSAVNSAPTIAWNTTPGTVASGQNYTVSAHGHDADGNLTQVNVWKSGVGFAFAGGGNGTDNDSGNATSDTGPATITFTANAVDSNGAASATISQTVTVAAPFSVSASIAASPTSAEAPGSSTITWTSADATSISVSGPGLNSTATSGSQAVSGLAVGTHTFTITAQGNGGPVTQSASVTVTAAPVVSASISASPTSATAPGSSTITWSSGNATSVAVSGPGLNSSAASSTQTVNGLAVGTHTFTIIAQGNGGPVTQSATVTITAAASVSASISASPTSTSAPGSSTISWSSANATAVSVSGSGVSSTATSGTQTVTGLAAGSYDYTITAQGPNGPATQAVTVVVASPATVTGAISVSPTTGTSPASTTVSWTTANATSVAVSGPSLASSTATGSQTVSGLAAGTHTFTLTAQDPGGPISRTATFTVSAPFPTVSGSISASPTTATAPGATTLTWSTADASSVFVSGPGVASTAPSGTQNVTGLAAGTHTYTLTAQGNGGPITRTVSVTVNPGSGVTAAISVSPSTMNVGGTATLTWSSANATSVRVTGFGISGSGFQNSPNLTINIGGLPPGQSTWTLVAEGTGGPITRTATITVNSVDGLAGSLTVSPTVIYSNQSATLAWTSSGANFRWVHGQLPSYNGVSIYPAPASGSTTVSGLSPGEYSFIFEYGPGAFSSTRGAYAYLTVLGVNRTITASVSPAGTGAVVGAGIYREGASVTLTATADATHVFTGWSGDLSSTSNPLTFTVGAQNYALVANFALRTYSVAASVAPAGAGSVTGSGSYGAGATATLNAIPDASHAFSGWTGDLVSLANPFSFVVNGPVSLTANFITTSFALTTAATAGGSVTPGGAYPAGSIVTVSATPDATYRFIDWTGDANGTAGTIAVTMDRAKFVQANFTAKASQTIAFNSPGDHALSSPPFNLFASATSGLPVSFSLLGGPAILTGNSVQLTGAGPVTVQASQLGDAFFLPAPPVNQTFNVISAATLKYRGEARTILRDESTAAPPPYVLEKP